MKRAMGVYLGVVLALATGGFLVADAAGGGGTPEDAASPARLTISARDEPIARVLQEIRQQTGTTIQKGQFALPMGSFNVTLEAKDQPFWEVFEKIMEQEASAPHTGPALQEVPWMIFQGGVMPANVAAARGAAISIPQGRMLISEPYLITLSRIEHQTDYKRLPVRERISAEVVLAPDPSVEIESMPAEVKPDHARDEDGHSLVWTHDLSEPAPVAALGSLSVLMEPPPAPAMLGNRIAEMDGSIPVKEIRSRRVEVGVDKTVTEACADFSARLELKRAAPAAGPADGKVGAAPGRAGRPPAPEERDPGGYVLTVEFSRNEGAEVTALNAWRNALQAFSAELDDAAGNSLRLMSSPGVNTAVGYTRVFNFAPAGGAGGGGEAGKAVVRLPVEMRVVKVPFKFENLPLR